MLSNNQITLSKQNLGCIRKAKEFIQLELDTNCGYSIYGTDESLVRTVKGLNSILKKFNYGLDKKKR
jgi:hypothetical protein